MVSRPAATLDAFLDFVKQARGFDFAGYKRSSIERRVAKRMAEVGVESYDDYTDYLELHPEEFASLFNSILINVTSFFRDPQTWEYLASEALPELLQTRPPDSPLRVWSAGCASGEEAYTLAMVLARVLGDDAFQQRVKIYATDVDEEALEQARTGAYLPKDLEGVPGDALDRFFERTDQRSVFRRDLRRCVIFGRNDLVHDAPISRIDLLVCRNTLMYFTAEAQGQILRRFRFALSDDGVLLLGKSEMLITHGDLFTPVDLKRRLFRKVLHGSRRYRERVVASDPAGGASQRVTDELREAAFDLGNPAQVVVDSQGALVMANNRARRAFGLGIKDFGRPIQDLELSYRPVELRSHLEDVATGGRPVELTGVRWIANGEDRVIDVRISPLMNDGLALGSVIAYSDVSELDTLREQLATSRRDLEHASDELQSTVEELETTNEELETTNEELQSTNEELQSTNEELETMNEELHSANEELEMINEELRHRTLELHDSNVFLEAILTATGVGVAVLDRDQRVRVWNAEAYELWGLTRDEVEDQNLLTLEFGLPTERLKSLLRHCLNDGSQREELVVEATDRRGNRFQCRVTCLPLEAEKDGQVSGVIMMMESVGD